MGTIARGVKAATGTTAFGANSVLLSSELNADFDVVVNEINGNLSNVNIASAAAIVRTKIVQPVYSITTATHDTAFADANEAVVTDLTGIAIPGSPNGVKQYKVTASARCINGDAANEATPIMRIRIGPLGTIADPDIITTYHNLGAGAAGDGQGNAVIPGYIIIPAAGDKVTMTVAFGIGPDVSHTVAFGGNSTYIMLEEM